MGVSGESLRAAMLELRPEIYGSIAEDKVELNGLHYIIDRLPLGIEECRFINLTSEEGLKASHFEVIIPPKRRRNCYRIDNEQMNIEITRGRSDIYDILTHLTFLFIESTKIMNNVLIDDERNVTRDWEKLEIAVKKTKRLSQKDKEGALAHAANILGRTFKETAAIYDDFSTEQHPDRFLSIIYWLGKRAIDEHLNDHDRVVSFTPILRERIGHHIHGEIWANKIKATLKKENLLHRPIHIISANMHSVMNTLFVPMAFKKKLEEKDVFEIYEELSKDENNALRKKVASEATKYGMIHLKDESGANIDIQIFDTEKLSFYKNTTEQEKPIIFVMDYAFGEQAYETIDELLKPYIDGEQHLHLDIASLSIMGKAGILEGGKGDIMIPSAHIFEGTADNYPFKNELEKKDIEGNGINVYEGTMITVLGTSLQNKDILEFFHNSTWNVIGLEMEGAHYQKAIQAASKIRGNIREDVKVRYAYYASDNPLETGSTLASGGLGTSGVKPTYIITEQIIKQILNH
jgi:hypothetical protein